MGSDDATADRPALERVYRTVTPGYRGQPNEGMHGVGLLMIAILLVVLIPLGPFLLVAWLLSKVFGAR